jgi:tetratricopeptide (TPR) repeat protein
MRPHLASALSKGDIDGAIDHYLAGLARSPNHAEAQYNVANALLRKGFEQMRPLITQKRSNCSRRMQMPTQPWEALFRERPSARRDRSIPGCPQIAPKIAAQSNLALAMTTSSDPSVRNGSEALRLAEQANRLSGGNRPVILHILAAAYGENGRFADAIQAAERALQFADAQNNSTLVDALRKEIALYQSGLPYHKQPR